MKNCKTTILIFLSLLINIYTYAQSTVIDYTLWNTNQCNAFYPFPPIINGLVHTSTCGQPKYDISNRWLKLDAYANGSNIYSGTEFKIDYNFKQGYSYTITVNALSKTPTFPEPNCGLRVEFTSASSGGGAFCNGVELLNGLIQTGINSTNQQIGLTYFSDKTYQFNSISTSKPSINICSNLLYINGAANSYVLIKKITITETTPAANFTLTPSTIAVQRGTSTSQTFTVNNINSTPGVTGYTWNIGTTPNGWVYNGSAAPAIINTSTNTLSLSSVTCANTISNISAIAIIGTTSYPTNSCLVSLSEPSYIINGSNLQCTATTQTYSLNTNPCNNNVVWSVNNSMVTLIPNGSSVDVSTNTLNGGSFSLTANITGVNGTVTISKQISVGPPPPITNIQTTYSRFKCNVIKYIFTVIGAESATNYQWYYRNITKGTGFTLFKNSSANFANSPVNDGSCDQIEIRVDATNACSITPVQYLFPSDLCPPFVDGSCTPTTALTISPNPSTGNIHLKLVDQPNVIPANTHEKKIMTIRIVDKMGQIKKTFNGNGFDEMTIDLSSLPTDIYTILVFNGKEWISKQINKN